MLFGRSLSVANLRASPESTASPKHHQAGLAMHISPFGVTRPRSELSQTDQASCVPFVDTRHSTLDSRLSTLDRSQLHFYSIDNH